MKNVSLLIFTFLLVNLFSSCAAENIISFEAAKQVDTIITFDPVTFEETIQIVETDRKGLKPKVVENYRIQVDTIITFDADTYEETIQIVKTKVKLKNN